VFFPFIVSNLKPTQGKTQP